MLKIYSIFCFIWFLVKGFLNRDFLGRDSIHPYRTVPNTISRWIGLQPYWYQNKINKHPGQLDRSTAASVVLTSVVFPQSETWQPKWALLWLLITLTYSWGPGPPGAVIIALCAVVSSAHCWSNVLPLTGLSWGSFVVLLIAY